MLMTENPSYDPGMVEPMREELRAVGFTDLLSAEDVDRCFARKDGCTLLVVNSVCGCAAGNARPGVALALQNGKIPDHSGAIFAGMEKAAINRFREYMDPMPHSSPCMVLLKAGEPMAILHRADIEECSADQVAGKLVRIFDEHCSATGPSITPEAYRGLEFVQICGSEIPGFDG